MTAARPDLPAWAPATGAVGHGDTLLEVIRRHAATGPRQVACHFLQAGRCAPLHRDDLLREAGCYARLLLHRGVRPGEVVLIILPHSPELLYAFLGAMLAGAVPSFMPPPTAKQDPQLYWSSHHQLFARIGTGALLTGRDHLAAVQRNLPALSLRLITAEEATDLTGPLPDFTAAPEQVAFLQHSSGTTGLKKGVALTHTAVLNQVRSYASALSLTSQDRIVSWLPLYHDMGLIACFLLPLLTGIPVVMMDPFEWVMNPGLLFAAVQEYRGTLCWLPNFAFHHLCRTVRPSPGLDLTSMRAWIDCSEPCRTETFQLFARTFFGAGVRPEQLQVCYAMAETVFAITQTQPGRAPRTLQPSPHDSRASALSAGIVVSGLQVRIRNEQGDTVPDGQVGEITVTGDCLFSGYFKLDEETRRKLCGGWYHTGDLGFMQEGELYVTGRKNDLIIVHGRNHYAHELEFIVNQVPGVHPGRCVATGWFKSEIGSEEVVVIAETDPALVSDPTQLVQTIKQALLDAAGLLVYDVRLVGAGWLVKTTSGKLSRSENLRKYLAALTHERAA